MVRFDGIVHSCDDVGFDLIIIGLAFDLFYHRELVKEDENVLLVL